MAGTPAGLLGPRHFSVINLSKSPIVKPAGGLYTASVVGYLTKQEQLVLVAVVTLLLVGWAVRSYRIATMSPGPRVVQSR
jgi:hypothetical protein